MENTRKISLGIIISHIILTVIVNTAISQVHEEWVARYDGEAECLVLDSDGNVYVSGTSPQGGTTIKYNPEGEIQWICGDCGTTKASAIDAQGNIYVAGYVAGYNYSAVKISPDGERLWQATYNGTGNGSDIAYAIAVDNQGNVYITGESLGTYPNMDYATVKYDSNGVEQWSARYNGPGNGYDLACDISVDDDENVYVSGSTLGLSTDYTTIKYDSLGNELWNMRYDGPANQMDVANAMTIDSDGNVYVTGESSAGGSSGDDFLTIKYSTDGEELWISRYDSPNHQSDGGAAIAVNDYRNVYVAGWTNSAIFSSEYATIKYDSAGGLKWVASYSQGLDYQSINDLALDNEGNVYVTGSSAVVGADYTTIKYSSSGSEGWVMHYSDPVNYADKARSIAVDNDGNVYVTGRSGSEYHPQYATIRYTQESAGIVSLNQSVPNRFGLYPAHPNPFNASTAISYQLLAVSNVNLTVFDITGREVATLVDGIKPAGSHQVVFDAKDLTSGVYFARLEAGEFRQTRKMLLIK